MLSILGTVGYIMNGSDIKEILSEVHAPNSVDMLLHCGNFPRVCRAGQLITLNTDHIYATYLRKLQ